MLLPPELIDHVFSFLQDDIPALNACSKAHPLYSRLAEPYLYAHIDFNFNPSATELCNHILENPRLLDYPRTLQIRISFPKRYPGVMSIAKMIPRMANLISLTIYGPFPRDEYEDFFSVFRSCQQPSFQQLSLLFLYNFPLSILDDAKNIKQLSLSHCTTNVQLIPGSPSQLSLETLTIDNPGLHRWAMRWFTHLTTLNLQELSPEYNWTDFPELLAACSNSLTRLHLNIDDCYYIYENFELPFRLSALTRLKNLSITAMFPPSTSDGPDGWRLPDDIRFIKQAPAIQDVVLQLLCHVPDCITFIGQLDWSFLGHLQSDSTGSRPHIDLCVTSMMINDPSFSPESILDALAKNEALMDLVKRGQVSLRAEHRTSA